MGLHLRPVGDLPESTYWRRRALVGGAVVLLLFLLLRACSGGDARSTGVITSLPSEPPATPLPSPTPAPAGGLSPSPSPTATASGSATATAGATATAAAGTCADGDLTVRVTTDAPAYPVRGTPQLRMSIRNTSAAACTRDLGQAAVELLVFSGPDRIWSSDDCAPGGGADLVRLSPGEERAITLTWAGRRSAKGCAGDKDPARPGTYRVVGRIGDLRSEGTSFRFST